MANVFIEASTMTAIGDAIRAKTGGMALIYPEDMPAQIASITTGGSGDGSDLVRYVTFLDEDGTQLYRMPVLVGDDCKDPITHGDISTPTKESTATNHFTYSGWTSTVGGTADADILKNITEDKTVYAAYAVSVRYYTVNFYANDALFETVQVEYGGTATPKNIPTKDGHKLDGWDPSPTNVTEDMDCYAVWVEQTFATASWEDIIFACQNNAVPSDWVVGDSKKMLIGDTEYLIDIIGINHDRYTSGGIAPLTFQLHDCYAVEHKMMESIETNQFGYGGTDMHKTTLPTIKALMPLAVQEAIKPVDKKTRVKGSSSTTEMISCELFLLSDNELLHAETYGAYQYYWGKAGDNSKKIKNLNGVATTWWLRQPHASNYTEFYCVYANGATMSEGASYKNCVSFAFCF